MYEVMNAHPVTMILVIGIMMATPIYALGTYVFSEASRTKGMQRRHCSCSSQLSPTILSPFPLAWWCRSSFHMQFSSTPCHY